MFASIARIKRAGLLGGSIRHRPPDRPRIHPLFIQAA